MGVIVAISDVMILAERRPGTFVDRNEGHLSTIYAILEQPGDCRLADEIIEFTGGEGRPTP